MPTLIEIENMTVEQLTKLRASEKDDATTRFIKARLDAKKRDEVLARQGAIITELESAVEELESAIRNREEVIAKLHEQIKELARKT